MFGVKKKGKPKVKKVFYFSYEMFTILLIIPPDMHQKSKDKSNVVSSLAGSPQFLWKVLVKLLPVAI